MKPAVTTSIDFATSYTAIPPQVFSIIVVMLILFIIGLIYYFKVKRLKPNESPRGLVLIVEIYVKWMRSLVYEILGPQFDKITPYFIFLFSYILLSNMIGIIGFENPTASLTVTLSLGFVTWIGIFAVGIKFQKLAFFKKYLFVLKIKGKEIPIMINPIEIVSAFTPLISISFRLWGNIFAGSLIISMWFYLMAYISSSIPILAVINILGGLTAPPIHGYFDILCGAIQALVFTLLTMVYWTLSKAEVDTNDNNEVNILKSIENLNLN